MDKWTVEIVEMRLEDAAQVMRRLPPVRVPGYFNLDGLSLRIAWVELPAQCACRRRRLPRSREWRKRSAGCAGERNDVKLVWARSERTPWKAICCRFGISRATLTGGISTRSA